jgi:outer membrane biosynthesis protein TonB
MMAAVEISEKTMNPSMQWRQPGVIAGIAISLLLHALLIFGYRMSPPESRPEPPARTLTVWLQAPEPPQIVAKVEPPPPPKPRPSQPRTRTPAPQPAERPSQPAPATAQTITLPPPADAPGTAPDPLRPEEQPKKFDMNAALKTARKVATEKGALQDPARAGTPVAQLDDHPLYPKQNTTELARKIDGAKRGDCKNTGAGLLSPLIWLLDKKDSGCKW